MPTPAIVLRKLRVQWYVGIRRKVQPPKIGAACGEILPQMGALVRRLGVSAVGAPVTLYHAHLEAEGLFDLQPGVFIARAVNAPHPFSSGEIPACEAAVLDHIGPYENLGDTHSALRDHVKKLRREPLAPCYEIYWTDPGNEPDPKKWRTEVIYPMKG